MGFIKSAVPLQHRAGNHPPGVPRSFLSKGPGSQEHQHVLDDVLAGITLKQPVRRSPEPANSGHTREAARVGKQYHTPRHRYGDPLMPECSRVHWT
jgi:hypothetical protein